jgi:hypothetical protein
MSALPQSVNYQEPLVVLPENTSNFEYTCSPVNGSLFEPSGQILIDLGNRGFLDPASLYFRYKITYTGVAAQIPSICGVPAYQPFLRLDTFANSQNIETINNYNTVAALNVNMQMNVADKLGQQFNLGYGHKDGGDVQLLNENTDGASFNMGAGTTKDFYYSAPLIGLLGNAEKLIPLFLLNNVRLALTLDSVANVSTNIAADAKITKFVISNFEVCYNCIDMGAEVQNEITRMNPKLRIKSSTWATSIAPSIASGVSGSQSLTFNLRYASVKSCFALFGGSDGAKSANRLLDSYDITSGNGDYQFQIGGINHPQKTLSTLNNKAGLMMELRKAMGSIFSNNVSLSVNNNEFSMVSTDVTTVFKPAKFIVAQNLQKMTVTSKGFFTGVSTQLAPIQLNINIGTATAQIHNPLLCINYDSILEIDSMTKSIMMIQ